MTQASLNFQPRASFTVQLAGYFRDREGQWINAVDLERFGRQAWRTRLSDARRQFGMRIENRQRHVKKADGSMWTISEYRYTQGS